MNFRVYVTLYWAIYVLTAVAKEIEIIEKRGVLPRCSAPLFPVDVLLLLDSSSSVTAWEFSQFLSLLMRLSSALPVGPVQVGLLSVSDFPVLEFRIGQHQTAAALQGSLGVLRQRGGDTNSGLALEWARRQGFAPGWGSRAGAHRVVLWITDGMSTDEVELPARLLKEAGVRVLLVSTGRSDHGIRTVASDHSSMFFTDTDNLPEISAQLCEAIVGSDSQSTGLSVFDIQSETASVSWPRFLIGSEGRYILEVTSWSAGRQSRVYQELDWESHGATLRNLQANTPYWLSLTSTSSSQGQRVLWGNFTTTALPGAAETLPVSSNLTASSANVREKGNNPNTLTDKKPAVSSNLTTSSANVREKGNNPNTLTDKKPAVTPNLSVSSANTRQRGRYPNTLTDKTLTERLSSPQHLMLTDVTSSSLVASWAEPEEQEVRQYKVRHIDSSGKIQEHSLPGHVRTVYLRDLAPRSAHVICVSALYKHGRSAETCARKRTLSAPVNKRRHIPYRLCAPYFNCKC